MKQFLILFLLLAVSCSSAERKIVGRVVFVAVTTAGGTAVGGPAGGAAAAGGSYMLVEQWDAEDDIEQAKEDAKEVTLAMVKAVAATASQEAADAALGTMADSVDKNLSTYAEKNSDWQTKAVYVVGFLIFAYLAKQYASAVFSRRRRESFMRDIGVSEEIIARHVGKAKKEELK